MRLEKKPICVDVKQDCIKLAQKYLSETAKRFYASLPASSDQDADDDNDGNISPRRIITYVALRCVSVGMVIKDDFPFNFIILGRICYLSIMMTQFSQLPTILNTRLLIRIAICWNFQKNLLGYKVEWIFFSRRKFT